MWAVALLSSYFLGAIPTGYLLVRLTSHVDIRTVGSGNIGATNALRTAGPWVGATVLIGDMLKGVIAAAVIPQLFLHAADPLRSLVCGAAAVIGHDFPCFLRFQGGKGVATTLGALLGTAQPLAGVVLGVWLITFAVSRYVSVGSLAAALAIPITQMFLHRPGLEVCLGALLGGLMIARHHANIQRLLRGAEHRAWSRHPSQ